MVRRETEAQKVARLAVAKARRAARQAAEEIRRVGDVAAATGATRERAAKAPAKAATWRGRREAAARIGADLPRVVRELFERGQIDAAHVKAAERYVADYHYGMCAPSMTQKWDRGVDGGARGEEGAARLDARARFIDRDKSLGVVRSVVFGVLIGGVTLEAVSGPGQRYASGTNRRVANGAALYLGLNALAHLYGLKETD